MTLNFRNRANLQDQMRRRLAQEVHVVEIPSGHEEDEEASCGKYAGLVRTDKLVYVAVSVAEWFK